MTQIVNIRKAFFIASRAFRIRAAAFWSFSLFFPWFRLQDFLPHRLAWL